MPVFSTRHIYLAIYLHEITQDDNEIIREWNIVERPMFFQYSIWVQDDPRMHIGHAKKGTAFDFVYYLAPGESWSGTKDFDVADDQWSLHTRPNIDYPDAWPHQLILLVQLGKLKRGNSTEKIEEELRIAKRQYTYGKAGKNDDGTPWKNPQGQYYQSSREWVERAVRNLAHADMLEDTFDGIATMLNVADKRAVARVKEIGHSKGSNPYRYAEWKEKHIERRYPGEFGSKYTLMSEERQPNSSMAEGAGPAT